MSAFTGAVGNVSSAVSGISSTFSSLGALGGSFASLFGGGSGVQTQPAGAWAQARRPATFGGVPIVIEETSFKRGRQIALHVYPFRDDPWPEDLGRSPRITSLRGFVIGNNPDSLRDQMITVAEKPGPIALVISSLGTVQVSVLEFAISDTKARGRTYQFEITVVPTTGRIYPVVAVSTQSQTTGFFGSLGASVSSTFAAVQSTVSQVQSQVTAAVQTVQGYASQAQNLVHDVTGLANLPAALAGNLGNVGRFAGVGIAGSSTFASLAQASGTINGAFTSVGRISSTLGGLAAKL